MKRKRVYFIVLLIIFLALLYLALEFFMLNRNNYKQKNFNHNSTKLDLSVEKLGQNPFGVHAAGGQYEMLSELKAGRRLIINLMLYSDKNRIKDLDYDIFKSNYGIYITFNSTKKNLKLTKYYLLNQSELQQAIENTKKLVERYDGDDDYGCAINNGKDCYVVGDSLYPRKELIEVLKQRPVKYWQVENEWLWQIIDPETGKSASDEKLLNQLKTISQAIKEADPEAKVIMGAFSSLNRPAALDGYNADGYIETGYIDCVYKKIFLEKATPKELDVARKGKERVLFFLEKGASYYDIVDFHSYNNNPVNFGLEAEWLKRQLKELGIKSKEIWSMENAGPFYFFNLLNLSQEKYCGKSIYDAKIHAEHVVKRYVSGLQSGVSRIFYSSLYPTKGWQENFTRLGLVEEDLTKKPAYYTYKIMTENLSGFSSVEKIDYQKKNVIIYKFTVGDKSVLVAWSDSGETLIDLTPYLSKQNVEIVHIVTELDSKNEPVYFSNEISPAKLVNINSSPIFIR